MVIKFEIATTAGRGESGAGRRERLWLLWGNQFFLVTKYELFCIRKNPINMEKNKGRLQDLIKKQLDIERHDNHLIKKQEKRECDYGLRWK